MRPPGDHLLVLVVAFYSTLIVAVLSAGIFF